MTATTQLEIVFGGEAPAIAVLIWLHVLILLSITRQRPGRCGHGFVSFPFSLPTCSMLPAPRFCENKIFRAYKERTEITGCEGSNWPLCCGFCRVIPCCRMLPNVADYSAYAMLCMDAETIVLLQQLQVLARLCAVLWRLW